MVAVIVVIVVVAVTVAVVTAVAVAMDVTSVVTNHFKEPSVVTIHHTNHFYARMGRSKSMQSYDPTR